MIRITMLGTAVVAVTAVGAALAGTRTGAPCPPAPVAGALDGPTAASATLATTALEGDRVIAVDRQGERRALEVDARGVLRHLTAVPGVGLVFVDDVAGPDDLIVATASGVERFAAGGEATHPDLSPAGALVWAEDGGRLRVRSSPGADPEEVASPPDAAAVFSPVFAPDGSIVAAAQEAVDGVPVEAEARSNLWRLDPATERWTRLTAFEGTPRRWTAVRTPVVRDSGEILFVRITGEAEATRPPEHELWRVDATGASEVRHLGDRRFLAGADGETVLWNVAAGTEWRLLAEGPEGARDLGCGHVLVDPVAEPDPDLAGNEDDPPAPSAVEIAAGRGEAEMAIVVGDFNSRGAAAAVAGELDIEGLRVIDHDAAPGAVAPGAFAVALRLPLDADPEAALQAFRGRFPRYVDRSWVTALG